MSEERHRSGSWWCQQSFINSWFRGGVTGEERDFIWHDRREESTCTAEMVYQYWWSFLLHCTTPPLMTENMLTYRYRVIRKYVPQALQAITCNTKHLPAKLFVSHSFYREAMFLYPWRETSNIKIMLFNSVALASKDDHFYFSNHPVFIDSTSCHRMMDWLIQYLNSPSSAD